MLFRPFAASKNLATIKAAGCGLTGTLPDLANLAITADGKVWGNWVSLLGKALQTVDISANSITHVDNFPSHAQAVTLAMNPSIDFSQGVLRRAAQRKVMLDLQGVKLLNTSEAEDMLVKKEFNETAHVTTTDRSKGFECRDIAGSSFVVTPSLFLPEKLCNCLAGWTGIGADCKECPKDTFRDSESLTCTPCPGGSHAKAGSASLMDCRCSSGTSLFKKDEWHCGCLADQALLDQTCVKCHPLKLICAQNGSEATSAEPQQGFARLAPNQTRAFQCFPPKGRCNATLGELRNQQGCLTGYTGILCAECEDSHRKDGDSCKPCPTSQQPFQWPAMVGVSLAIAIVAIIVFVAMIIWRRSPVHPGITTGVLGVARQLGASQVPLLLQTCQLWPVLAAMTMSTGSTDIDMSKSQGSSLWELPYVETLQLSVDTLKGYLNLQCQYHGVSVRLSFALFAPVFPVVILGLCLTLEGFQHGSGIGMALKALTLLYIGGANSVSNLLKCQTVDAAGEALPPDFHFRTLLPNLRCQDSTELLRYVDSVAYLTAAVYVFIIPGCLAFLFAKQQVVTQEARTMFAAADFAQGELKLSLQHLVHFHESKERNHRHLMASATAYISVLLRGQVRMRMSSDSPFVRERPIWVESCFFLSVSCFPGVSCL